MTGKFILGASGPPFNQGSQAADLSELYAHGGRQYPTPEEISARYPRPGLNAVAIGATLSSWLMFLTQSILGLLLVVFLLDLVTGNKASTRLAHTLGMLNETLSTDDIALARAQTDAEIQRYHSQIVLNAADEMSAGDKALCFLEDFAGGLLGYSNDTQAQTMGAMMRANCDRRQQGTQDWLNAATKNSNLGMYGN